MISKYTGPSRGLLKHAATALAMIKQERKPKGALNKEEMLKVEAGIGPMMSTVADSQKRTIEAVDESRTRNFLALFAEDITEPLRTDLARVVKLNKDNFAVFQKMEAEIKTLQQQLQAAHGETRAAQEGRGVFENSKLSEMTADRDARIAEVRRMTEEAARLTQEIGKLKNELTGRAAALTGYEREKAELMGAAVLTAEAMRTAREQLGEAKLNIEDRYGAKIPAFWDTIHANISAALAALPKV